MGSFLRPGLVPRKAARTRHEPDFPWVLGGGARTHVLGNNGSQKPGVGCGHAPVERGGLAAGQVFRNAQGPRTAQPQPRLQALKTHPSGTGTCDLAPVSVLLVFTATWQPTCQRGHVWGAWEGAPGRARVLEQFPSFSSCMNLGDHVTCQLWGSHVEEEGSGGAGLQDGVTPAVHAWWGGLPFLGLSHGGVPCALGPGGQFTASVLWGWAAPRDVG